MTLPEDEPYIMCTPHFCRARTKEDDCLYCKCKGCDFCSPRVAAPTIANTTTTSTPGGNGGGGLRNDIDLLRGELDLAPAGAGAAMSMTMTAVVKLACEALCVANSGPLLSLVKALRAQAQTQRERLRKVLKELDVAESMPLVRAIAAAEQKLGLTAMKEGATICQLVDRLVEAVGVRL